LKNKAFILLIILLSGITIISLIIKHQYRPEITTIGSVVPDIELIDINKNKIKLSELRGAVVFINFWATWCEPCINELPSIEELFRLTSGNPKFKLITILYKDDEYRAFNFMKENRFTLPIYLNPDGSAAKNFGITGVPETFIIDKKGTLRNKIIGPAEWDSPDAIQAFQALVNEPD
jgi:cytochrome c biogenesis protein CcmG/thiol:disulfide interchange protein DsbE